MSVQAQTPMPVPPWMAMVQAHADQAESHLQGLARDRRAAAETTQSLARDITTGAFEEVRGRRPASHRKEIQS